MSEVQALAECEICGRVTFGFPLICDGCGASHLLCASCENWLRKMKVLERTLQACPFSQEFKMAVYESGPCDPCAQEGNSYRRKPLPGAGTASYADRTKTVEASVRIPPMSREEQVAASLMGTRAEETVRGWTTKDLETLQRFAGQESVEGLLGCDDARRIKCEKIQSCLWCEGSGLKSSKGSTPESEFLKCRKVTIQIVRTVQESWTKLLEGEGDG